MFSMEPMSGTGKKGEAMLYYLYMISDGEVSYNEEKMFDEICKELRLNEEEKKAVVNKCKEKALCSKSSFDAIMIEKLDEQVGKSLFGFKNASSLARIIWNLINLGYADTCFSGEEKKIVEYLIKKWNVKQEVYGEMINTADTMLALTKQKEWLMSTYEKGSIRDKKEKKIDFEIATMLSDIKTTIEELTI